MPDNWYFNMLQQNDNERYITRLNRERSERQEKMKAAKDLGSQPNPEPK